jgi:WD40 repeat protein
LISTQPLLSKQKQASPAEQKQSKSKLLNSRLIDMALTLKATETGLKIIDLARRQKGWNKAAESWLIAAGNISRSSLDKFWARQPIKYENFVAICAAVGVDWETVVDSSPSEVERNESEANKSDKFNGLKIAKQIHDWLTALRYEFESHEDFQVDYCEFIIRIPVRRGRFDRILIRGIPSEAKMMDLQALRGSVDKHQTDEGWLIVNRRISPAVQIELAKDESQHLSCMTFDELIDQDADFEPYLKWLEDEVIKRGINRKYVSLACDKKEIDPVTQQPIATSTYSEAEGWIEGYIKQWLSDDSKEHVSILGEFGTGKTWFSFHYAWECLEAYKKEKKEGGERPRLPLVIALRDYNKALKVESVLSDLFFNKHDIRLNSSVFDCLNKMGKLLIIFDGFDEMADKVDRQKMIDNFWELSRVICPGSKVILTSRIEHFRKDKDSRNLFNGESKSPLTNLKWEAPRFELLELVKFNKTQILKVLTFEAEEKELGIDIVEKVMLQPELLDLASRPMMTELIIEAMPAIKLGELVNISLIYYYAIVQKMKRDIETERTFTSLADKLYFLCEIAWEMLSTERMKLNYREFPDRIRKIFKESVQEQKDIDHWQYDMMGQTILIRNADGDYTPAHRSFLEFLVAYKFAAELGLLKIDYLPAAQQQTENCIDIKATPQLYTWREYLQKSIEAKCADSKIAPLLRFKEEPCDYLRKTFGHEVLMETIIDLILPMLELPNIRGAIENPLLNQILDTKGKADTETSFLGGNAATLLVKQNPGALSFENLSHTHLAHSNLLEANLQHANFNGANLTNSLFKSVLSSTVLSVAPSQDSKTFVTGHEDGIVRLWDALTGQLIYSCTGHQDSVRAVAISADCSWFISGSRDQTIKRWELKTGNCLTTYKGHTNSLRSVVIAPKGDRIISGSDDQTIKHWDVDTGRCLNTYRGHEKSVRAVTISPDSYWVVSGSVDKTLKRWDIKTGKCLNTYGGHTDWVWAVAISSDGKWLVSASIDKTLKRWNTDTGECLNTYEGHADWVWAVAISSNGKWIISASNDKTLKRWNTDTGECLNTYEGHTDWVWAVAISSDNSLLMSGSQDNTLKRWNIETGKCLDTYAGYKDLVSTVAISPDASWFVSASHDKILKRWDTEGKCLHTYSGHQDVVSAVAISPDGTYFISASNDKTIKFWDTNTGKCLYTYTKCKDLIRTIAISPDGSWFISESGNQTLKHGDIHTGQCFDIYTGYNEVVSAVTISPDGSWLISESGNNTPKRLRNKNECIQNYRGHQSLVGAVAISQNGHWLITGSVDKTIKRWNIKTGVCLYTYTGHRDPVKSVAISSDNRYIISCAGDEIKIWKVNTGKCIRTIFNKSCAAMQIRDVVGLTLGQIESLKALGAVDD